MTQILVIGPSRTGTSMVAGALHRMGVNMGERMLGAVPDNVLGLHEDMAFTRLNRAVLKMAGGSWDNPPSRQAIEALYDVVAPTLREFVRGRDDAHALWGAKDPRASLLLPLWEPLLSDAHFVLTTRDIDAVTASLVTRNRFTPERARDLTLIYMDRIARRFEGDDSDNVFRLRYEEALEHPAQTVEALAAFVGREPTPEAVAFITPGMNHHAR